MNYIIWITIGIVIGIVSEWAFNIYKLKQLGLFAKDGHLMNYNEIKEAKE